MAFRLDYGRLDKADRTPSGGLKIPANVTRIGVFTYRTDTGQTVRELRHPDHVFSKESLDSMEDAPLTVRHPGKVTPKDYKTNAVGHIRDVRGAAAAGPFVQARAIVQDAKAIEGVDKGELVEVSCGYSCDVDPTPGEWNGEKYDSIQTNIRYNHVALGPKGWGRAGASVALRLDSGDAIQESDASPLTPTDAPPDPPKEPTQMALITIAGKPYTVGTPEHIQALTDHAATESKRADDAESGLATAKTQASEATGRADAATAALKAETAPEAISKKVNDRLALQASAAKVLGKDFKFDGKTDIEVMTAAVVKADPAFKADGAEPAYIRGAFSLAASRQYSVGTVRAAAHDAQAPTKADKTFEQKRADSRQESEDAWKQPLALSRK